MPLPAPVYEKLQSVFGFAALRPNQEPIIEALIAGRDVFGIMPTGGGKSLCYQLPACVMPGTVVVVSPLISLMKDQVDAAAANGIACAALNSAQPEPIRRRVVAKLLSHELDLLYVSPERLALDGFTELLGRARIAAFAIDEAHCISEWGHDFRPDYLFLSQLTTRFPAAAIAAFTATATHRVQNDIVARLHLREPLVVRASFDRPNLTYRVLPRDNAAAQILRFLEKRPLENGIVYRMSRSSVESTARQLQSRGVAALPYHAGLSDQERHGNQDAFNRDEVRVIVATIAFGMGIDKSNVRFVIHGDLPKNMESYYQETGRGGRDGAPADCLLLYSGGDIARVRSFIDNVEDAGERKRLLDGLYAVAAYARSNSCRRRALLGYFGEEYPHPACGTCDVCLGEVDTVDATAEAQMLLSAIARTGERFGTGYLSELLCGAENDRMVRLGHTRLPTFGVGAGHSKTYWRMLAGELAAQGIIAPTTDQYPVLKLLPKARQVLTGTSPVAITRHTEPVRGKRSRTRTAAVPATGAEGLFERLRALRMELARSAGVPPYIVFTDKSLREMAQLRPRTEEELLCINGVGQSKLQRFGAPFLEAINGCAP